MADQVLSKSEFAAHIGVTPGRISQMIAEGKISGPAIRGEGRAARIVVDVAKRQIGDRTDVGQRFGNGLDTRLDVGGGEAPPVQTTIGPTNAVRESRDPLAEQIKTEKLRQLQFTTRRQAEEERARAGLYVRADQTAASMARLAGGMITVFEGGLGDLAQAISARFQIPTRDVAHLLRTEFSGLRSKAAAEARRHSETLPALVVDETPDASDPAAGEA